MHAVMWSDYVCPWAYLGRDRAALLRDLGIELTVLPFELHPEIPRHGVPVRPGGRLANVFAHIAEECAAVDLPFTAPTVSRNSRLALETVEVVRRRAPDCLPALDEALARTYWVDGGDISDPEIVGRLVAASGAPRATIEECVADGEGAAAVHESMARAREVGVTATPAWWVDDRLLIPGAQPRESLARWVTRMQSAS